MSGHVCNIGEEPAFSCDEIHEITADLFARQTNAVHVQRITLITQSRNEGLLDSVGQF